MSNSDHAIEYASIISNVLIVFDSLGWEAEMQSYSLLLQALSKVPPIPREPWSLSTVNEDLLKAFLVDFHNWLLKNSEDQDVMQHISTVKTGKDDSIQSQRITSTSNVLTIESNNFAKTYFDVI